MELTPQEQAFIAQARLEGVNLTLQALYLMKVSQDLKPFEVIEIHKDPSGLPKRFRVKRTQDIMITEIAIAGVKL